MATTGASLQSIYDRLSSVAEYHPFNADTFSDWSMEAGDLITVKRDGNNYTSPVHSSELSWKGQSQISVSSDGNEKRESISKATKKKYSRSGSGYRNDSHLQQELVDTYNGLYSYFEVTSSRMYAEFKGDYDGLAGLFEVTRSRMGAEFMDAYNGLAGAFEVTAGHMATAFLDSYNGLAGAFEVTASQMAADFSGAYDGLVGHFEVTRSQMAAEFKGDYDGLVGLFEVTRSQMAAEFRGNYDGLVGHFETTRSQMAAAFYGAYDGLKGSFNVTRSQMAADFSSAYDGLVGHFEVTRSLFNVALQDSYQQLTSGFQAAANYSMMYSEGYVNGKVTRANILTLINDRTGQSEAYIDADNILIGTGTQNAKVNLANVITLGDSSTVLIKKNVTVNETYGANGVKLMTDGTIRGHQLTLIKTGGQEGEYAVESITSDDIDEMVIKAQLDGDTLRLWTRGADLTKTSGDGIINFSKAVTLSGAWDNGNFPLTINATQTNNGVTTNVGANTIGFTNAADFYLTVEKNGDPTAFGSSKKLINVPFKIVHHAGGIVGDQDRYASSLASVDATNVYNNGWDDVVLNDPVWGTKPNEDNTTASNSLIVSASDKIDGTARSKAIPIALTVDTTNKKAKVSAGGYVRAIENIDMKTNAEYNTAVANAGYAGRAAVTISDTITWGTAPSSGISVSSNSIKVSTAGRTTSDGTIQQSEKTINLYTQSSTSGLTATFYVTHTDSTDAKRILKKTATCSDANLKAANIKSGVSIFGVTGSYSETHSPTVSSLTYHGTSDPGSAYEKRQVNVDNASEYYKFTANCGGKSKNYAFYVNNRAYSSRYDEGFKAGWKAYYNDSTHWQSNYYNSSTGKYEAWVPSSTVTKNSSGQWVGSFDSKAWFSYTNASDYSIGVSAPENSNYYISNSAPGNSITDFTSGATRLYSNKWVVNGYHYKFKVTAGSKSKWYWFRAGS